MRLTVVTAVLDVVASCGRESLVCCVESIAKLPVEHEHLIYDGGSTDGTMELLRELAARTPTLRVVSEPDTGIYNALNKGVRDARGDWFYVLGCDDYVFAPDVLARCVEEGEAKGVDMVCSPIRVDIPNADVNRWRDRLCLCTIPYPHQGILMRTSLVRRLGGFDERYRIVADFDLVQRAIFGGVKLHEVYVPYAQFGMSGTSQKDKAKTAADFRQVVMDRFGLRGNEASRLYPLRILPLRVVVPLLFGGERIVRRAAMYQFARWCAYRIGLINDQGYFVSHWLARSNRRRT